MIDIFGRKFRCAVNLPSFVHKPTNFNLPTIPTTTTTTPVILTKTLPPHPLQTIEIPTPLKPKPKLLTKYPQNIQICTNFVYICTIFVHIILKNKN